MVTGPTDAGTATILDVLVVEDNDGDALLLQEAMENAAAATGQRLRIRRARSVREASGALEERQPDCVLLDLGLPDARDDLHALREVLRIAPTVAVVVVTGRTDLAASAVLAGAQDYLVKSTEPAGEDLLRAVLFGARRARSVAALRMARDELALFASRVAHDLRSPLTSIVGYAELLLRRPNLHDEQREALLQQIADAGRGMSRMVDGMLRFAESAGGHIESVDLQDVVDWVQPLVRGFIEGAGGSMRVLELHKVQADEPALRTVLLNLVTNAVKYRSPERALRITVWSQQVDDTVELLVQDNGIGIPPDEREAVFEFGHRLEVEPAVEGVGLGLSAVRRILEELDGHVEVGDTDSGHGVRVRVVLPAADERDHADGVQREPGD